MAAVVVLGPGGVLGAGGVFGSGGLGLLSGTAAQYASAAAAGFAAGGIQGGNLNSALKGALTAAGITFLGNTISGLLGGGEGSISGEHSAEINDTGVDRDFADWVKDQNSPPPAQLDRIVIEERFRGFFERHQERMGELFLLGAEGWAISQTTRGAGRGAMPRPAISRAIVPGRVQSRINLSNEGMTHTTNNHLNPARTGKSQFSMSESEVRSALQSKEVISAPARPLESSGNFIREVDLGRQVGVSFGKPTNILSVITDGAGNLKSAFPGTLH